MASVEAAGVHPVQIEPAMEALTYGYRGGEGTQRAALDRDRGVLGPASLRAGVADLPDFLADRCFQARAVAVTESDCGDRLGVSKG
jgi:hypothetical protein